MSYAPSRSVKRLGELAGTRTQDPRIKSALLYQLSYELIYSAIRWNESFYLFCNSLYLNNPSIEVEKYPDPVWPQLSSGPVSAETR